VAQVVLELEEPYRSTVLLRFFEDLEPREIAARQGGERG
jgi:DNA-directed RNA polymerase specialized sigma24 family protein